MGFSQGGQQGQMRVLTVAQAKQPRVQGSVKAWWPEQASCGWARASADPRASPQGTPRAPSPDEECFFNLLSKFQSSRMDDQRCPLEEGQLGAAEATAAPTLEERMGECHPPGSPWP